MPLLTNQLCLLHANIRRRTVHGCRYSCLTWNVGGLSRESWNALTAWLDLQDIDIIMLQETHWKHTSEWVPGKYFCFHAGAPSHCAVLTMVAKTFCRANNMSWWDAFPSRILHTRLYFSTRAIDVLDVYQFVNGHSRMHGACTILANSSSNIE